MSLQSDDIKEIQGRRWKGLALIFRPTGDPWQDLDQWKLATRIEREHAVPFFVLDPPVFPTPEEQRARLESD